MMEFVNGKDDIHDYPIYEMENKSHVWNHQPVMNQCESKTLWEWLSHILWKIKNVWNHQPVIHFPLNHRFLRAKEHRPCRPVLFFRRLLDLVCFSGDHCNSVFTALHLLPPEMVIHFRNSYYKHLYWIYY